MNPKDILRTLKSKIESEAAIQENQTVITDICGDIKHANAIVMKEIEGQVQLIEVTARLLGTQKWFIGRAG